MIFFNFIKIIKKHKEEDFLKNSSDNFKRLFDLFRMIINIESWLNFSFFILFGILSLYAFFSDTHLYLIYIWLFGTIMIYLFITPTANLILKYFFSEIFKAELTKNKEYKKYLIDKKIINTDLKLTF